eukprot:SAG31_NODE_20000_length_586_cov_1.574949_1_plen_95_part_10
MWMSLNVWLVCLHNAVPTMRNLPCRTNVSFICVRASACQQCMGNATTPVPGAVSVTECRCVGGYFGFIENASSTCEACEVGKYAPFDAPRCSECP